MAKEKSPDADAVRESLAKAEPTAAITQRPADEFGSFVAKYSSAIVAGLPESYGQDSDKKLQRFVRVLATEVRRNPKLMEQERRVSLIAAMCLAAQLGLEPGPTQKVFFIPYGNEVQFQLGWRGIVELAYRSGQVKVMDTFVVREGDVFESGIRNWKPYMDFRPKFTGEDRPMELVVAYAELTNGNVLHEVMEKPDVDSIMARSQSSKAQKDAEGTWTAKGGPWASDYDEMARKTVLKRLAKRVPMSEEDKRAIEQDEGVFESIEPHMVDVPDTREHTDLFAVGVPVPKRAPDTQPEADPDTGEVLEGEPEEGELVDADDNECPRRSVENCSADKCFPDACPDPRGPLTE